MRQERYKRELRIKKRRRSKLGLYLYCDTRVDGKPIYCNQLCYINIFVNIR